MPGNYDLGVAHGKIVVTVDWNGVKQAIKELQSAWDGLILDAKRFELGLAEFWPTRERAIYNVINMPWIKNNWIALAGSRWSWQITRLRREIETREHIKWAADMKNEGTVRNNE